MPSDIKYEPRATPTVRSATSADLGLMAMAGRDAYLLEEIEGKGWVEATPKIARAGAEGLAYSTGILGLAGNTVEGARSISTEIAADIRHFAGRIIATLNGSFDLNTFKFTPGKSTL